MWDFAKEVLERYGLVSVVILANLGMFGQAVRALWTRCKVLEVQLLEATKENETLRADLAIKYGIEKAAAVEEARTFYAEGVEQARRETMRLAERVDQLQEKRVAESQVVVREVVEHMQATRQSVDKVATTMATLQDVLRRN